jgi:hypothetical protein
MSNEDAELLQALQDLQNEGLVEQLPDGAWLIAKPADDAATRDLQELQRAGVVEQLPDGTWRMDNPVEAVRLLHALDEFRELERKGLAVQLPNGNWRLSDLGRALQDFPDAPSLIDTN